MFGGVEMDMNDRVDTLEQRVDTLFRAFPSGDVEGHRRAHDLMIEQLNERRRLRQAIQEKTISGLIWASVLGLGTMVWQAIKSALR